MSAADTYLVAVASYFRDICVPYFRARFHRTEQGASLVEYALLVALIAVVCIAAITLFGQNSSSKFSNVASILG